MNIFVVVKKTTGKTSPISGELQSSNNLLAQFNNMAGYLKGPPGGPHGHFSPHHPHPSLGSGLPANLSGMSIPGISPFGLPPHLEPVPFPNGNYLCLLLRNFH